MRTGQFGWSFAPSFLAIGSFALTPPDAPNSISATAYFALLDNLLISEFDRRQFLSRGLAAVGATWTAAQWPAILAAAEHAHKSITSGAPEKFEFLTPAEAKEVEAISSCIIPSDATPGAREAGVVYFIDRALATFSSDDQKTYREGLPGVQSRLKELFPTATLFSAATVEQQQAVLESLDEQGAKTPPRRPRANFISGSKAQPLFETVRAHTLMGFLIDPDSDRRGNRGGVGWTLIGRDLQHGFQPPFGAYDKGYPGFQPAAAKESAKK